MPKFKQELKQTLTRAQGQSFFVTATVVATGVLTTATALTTAATGRLYIDEIVLDTDATGLNSTANAFTINVAKNTYGNTTVVSQVTSGLGASVSLAFGGSSNPTTYRRIVLDAGAYLTFQVATAAATGAGNIRMTVKLSRIDENANCLAALV